MAQRCSRCGERLEENFRCLSCGQSHADHVLVETMDAIEAILIADLEFDADDSGAVAHVIEREDA